MKDQIEKLGTAQIQHGKASDRIYLMKLGGEDAAGIIRRIQDLASREQYSKIFCKVPASARVAFEHANYTLEATVPGFFNGTMAGLFFSKFLDPNRAEETHRAEHESVILAARAKAGMGPAEPGVSGLSWRVCEEKDAPAMAEVYGEVFESYPFPIHDPAYLVETMRSHVLYFGVWRDEKLIALSSAEMDKEARNAEMTDFATLPSERGAGLGAHLLAQMEPAMRERGIRTAYTIARAVSHGMNITFAKLGYSYAGRLINNTQISGALESMNVWYKPL